MMQANSRLAFYERNDLVPADTEAIIDMNGTGTSVRSAMLEWGAFIKHGFAVRTVRH
jgi:hypothetical protein